MFIEVSSTSEKIIVNTSEIVSVRVGDESTIIEFAHIVYGISTKLFVDQSYEELLGLLVGVKE